MQEQHQTMSYLKLLCNVLRWIYIYIHKQLTFKALFILSSLENSLHFQNLSRFDNVTNIIQKRKSYP